MKSKQTEFFELFDRYESMREQLKAAEDGSAEERYLIADLATTWNELVNARRAITKKLLKRPAAHDEITRCLTCAKEVEPYTLDCDECVSKYTSAAH